MGVSTELCFNDCEVNKRKRETLLSEFKKLLKVPKVKIIQVAKVLGLMVSKFPGVEYGPLFYRNLQNQKIDALKRNAGNFEAYMSLNNESKNDINWWIKTISKIETCKLILRGNPDLTLRTDASGLGWGAQLNDNGTCVETGGRWEGNELELHINAQELMAVQLSLKALCKKYRNCHIRIESDNATTV